MVIFHSKMLVYQVSTVVCFIYQLGKPQTSALIPWVHPAAQQRMWIYISHEGQLSHHKKATVISTINHS